MVSLAAARDYTTGRRRHETRIHARTRSAYFLRLGTTGFGGPVALVGLMERDLVTNRGWLTREEMREIDRSQPIAAWARSRIQVGIFIAYLRCGFWGAWAGGWAFILPNFLMVAALGALYVHFGGLSWMTAIFYGVSPAVIALILHSCWRLAKLGMDDKFQWLIAALAFAITVALAGRGRAAVHRRRHRGILVLRLALPFDAARSARPPFAAPIADWHARRQRAAASLRKLLWFFLKAGSLTFGSGLVDRAVPGKGPGAGDGLDRSAPVPCRCGAIGMLSPGPVVITATFVGYLVAGFWGSLVSTIGIFLPSFLLILIAAPISAPPSRQCRRAGLHQGCLRRRYRHHPRRLHPARPHRHRRLADSADRRRKPRRLFRFKVSNPCPSVARPR